MGSEGDGQGTLSSEMVRWKEGDVDERRWDFP